MDRLNKNIQGEGPFDGQGDCPSGHFSFSTDHRPYENFENTDPTAETYNKHTQVPGSFSDKSRAVLKKGKPIIILLCLGFIYLFVFNTFHVGIPCIFRKLTGLLCPGCGMTHAMAEIWNGDLAAAFECNALSVTVLPVLCIYLLYRYIRNIRKADEKFYAWEYVLLLVMTIIALGYAYMRNQ